MSLEEVQRINNHRGFVRRLQFLVLFLAATVFLLPTGNVFGRVTGKTEPQTQGFIETRDQNQLKPEEDEHEPTQ